MALSIPELRRRVRILENRSETSQRVHDPSSRLGLMSDPMTPEEIAQFDVEYIRAWVWLFIELLRFLGRSDPSYAARLGEARREFYRRMAKEDASWQHVLAECLKEALP